MLHAINCRSTNGSPLFIGSRVIGFVICVVISLVSFRREVFSADQRHEELRSYLLAGIRAEKDRMRSGHAVLSGEHVINNDEVKDFRVPVRYEIAFDLDTKRFRHTQLDYAPHAVSKLPGNLKLANPDRPDVAAGISDTGMAWSARASGGTVVRTPDYDLHRPIQTSNVTRLPSGDLRNTTVSEWDITALGLLHWGSFERCMKTDYILNSWQTRLACHSVTMDDSEIARLRMRSDDTEYEVWIDEAHGMTPIRVVKRALARPEVDLSVSSTTWKLLDELWVPESCRIEDIEGGRSYSLAIEWKSVNQPLDDHLFSPQGVGEEKSFMVDLTLGPVVLERVNPLPMPSRFPHANQPISPTRWWVIFWFHVCVASGSFFWYWRFRRAR